MTHRRRIVPVGLWRRLLSTLSPAAIKAGDATGAPVELYRRNRAEGSGPFDAAIWQQAVELQAEIVRRNGAGSIGELLHDMCVGLSPYRQPEFSGPMAGLQRANHARATSEKAQALGDALRDLAVIADVLAICLTLRAEDHEDCQRFKTCRDQPRREQAPKCG